MGAPQTDWSRPFHTAHLRGNPRGLPPFDAIEELEVHESSLAFRALSLLPRYRDRPLTVEGRQARVDEVRAHPAYRRWERLRGTRLYSALWSRGQHAPAPEPPAQEEAPPAAGPPQLPPHVSRRVDEAVELLRHIPWEELQRRGWHFQPNHFYWPLNDVAWLAENRDLWQGRGLPAGIDWDVGGQVALVEKLAGYAHELDDVVRHPDPARVDFVWENNAFGGADAIVYYGLLRELEPSRVIEIGCGWSSLLLARALERNGKDCRVTLVEPYPDQRLLSSLPADWELHRTPLQHADLALFEEIGEGDVCFYDGSHCVGTASDVNWFFFEVLPRLGKGAMVHVHDIFFPDDYPEDAVFEEGWSWNEQYLVQAFLMHNESYRVRAVNHLLARQRRDDLERAYEPLPVLPAADGGDVVGGGSLWLEKTR